MLEVNRIEDSQSKIATNLGPYRLAVRILDLQSNNVDSNSTRDAIIGELAHFGRAPALHAGGDQFDPGILHQF